MGPRVRGDDDRIFNTTPSAFRLHREDESFEAFHAGQLYRALAFLVLFFFFFTFVAETFFAGFFAAFLADFLLAAFFVAFFATCFFAVFFLAAFAAAAVFLAAFF